MDDIYPFGYIAEQFLAVTKNSVKFRLEEDRQEKKAYF